GGHAHDGADVIDAHERAGVDDDSAEFLRGQKTDDHFGTVGESEENSIAAAHAEAGEAAGHAIHVREHFAVIPSLLAIDNGRRVAVAIGGVIDKSAKSAAGIVEGARNSVLVELR